MARVADRALEAAAGALAAEYDYKLGEVEEFYTRAYWLRTTKPVVAAYLDALLGGLPEEALSHARTIHDRVADDLEARGEHYEDIHRSSIHAAISSFLRSLRTGLGDG